MKETRTVQRTVKRQREVRWTKKSNEYTVSNDLNTKSNFPTE
jgi:hypothetical protein